MYTLLGLTNALLVQLPLREVYIHTCGNSVNFSLSCRARLFGSDVIVLVLIFSFLAPSAKAEASTVTTNERAPSGHLVVDDLWSAGPR